MKQRSYASFWRRIHRAARKKEFPVRVMLELTYRCNFLCGHCYVPWHYREKSKEQELSTRGIFSILDQLADIGCLYLGFTGGEPFVRADIMDILWYAKRKGFEIIIYTNGSLINEEIASELERLKPNKIDITIPAMSKDAFERISGVKGSHQQVFAAIELLSAHRMNLGFKSCVLKDNQFEIKEIESFAHTLAAPYRLDDLLSPRLDGSKKPYEYRGYLGNGRKTDTQPKDEKELVICNAQSSEKTKTSLFNCGVGQTQVAITPFGELKMCLMIDYPKLKITESTLAERWEELKEFVHNIKVDQQFHCATCELVYFCKWCPARGWLDSRNFCRCEAHSREWAKTKRETYEMVH